MEPRLYVKMVELIEVPFGLWTRVGVRRHVLDGGITLSPRGEYDWTVHVWRWCGLFVKLLWPVVLASFFSAVTLCGTRWWTTRACDRVRSRGCASRWWTFPPRASSRPTARSRSTRGRSGASSRPTTNCRRPTRRRSRNRKPSRPANKSHAWIARTWYGRRRVSRAWMYAMPVTCRCQVLSWRNCSFCTLLADSLVVFVYLVRPLALCVTSPSGLFGNGFRWQ